jgi:hypothetical protein
LSDDEAAIIKEWSRASSELMEEIRPFLAGKGAEVQSAALADLTSMWLAGMFLIDKETGELNRRRTDAMRGHALKAFVNTVLELLPVNEEIITKPLLDKKLHTQ